MPYDGVRDGTASASLPDYGCLALVRDADCDELAWANLGGFEQLLDRFHHGIEDLVGVVLYPAELGVNLGDFLVGLPDDPSGAVN